MIVHTVIICLSNGLPIGPNGHCTLIGPNGHCTLRGGGYHAIQLLSPAHLYDRLSLCDLSLQYGLVPLGLHLISLPCQSLYLGLQLCNQCIPRVCLPCWLYWWELHLGLHVRLILTPGSWRYIRLNLLPACNLLLVLHLHIGLTWLGWLNWSPGRLVLSCIVSLSSSSPFVSCPPPIGDCSWNY